MQIIYPYFFVLFRGKYNGGLLDWKNSMKKPFILDCAAILLREGFVQEFMQIGGDRYIDHSELARDDLFLDRF